ncbi:hypothetical protein PaeBR_05150 [Paenibacillus sp. BR2-3]
MEFSKTTEIQALYKQLIDAWNNHYILNIEQLEKKLHKAIERQEEK